MLFLHIFTSLDGYIEDEGGGVEWMGESEDFDGYIVDLLNSLDGMVFGRAAHDLLAQYWPTAGERADARSVQGEMARLMNALPKYVLTRSGRCAAWRNSHPVDVPALAALKDQAIRDIAVFAGAAAARSLLEQGLLDQVQLLVNPVLLGGGKPLFIGGPQRELTLVETLPFTSGVVKLAYDLTEPLPAGLRPSEAWSASASGYA